MINHRSSIQGRRDVLLLHKLLILTFYGFQMDCFSPFKIKWQTIDFCCHIGSGGPKLFAMVAASLTVNLDLYPFISQWPKRARLSEICRGWIFLGESLIFDLVEVFYCGKDVLMIRTGGEFLMLTKIEKLKCSVFTIISTVFFLTTWNFACLEFYACKNFNQKLVDAWLMLKFIVLLYKTKNPTW